MRYIPILLFLAACSRPPQVTPPVAPVPSTLETVPESARDHATVGVLVMAHGGTEEWNAAVHEAVRPLAESVLTEVAFGMADPLSLDASVTALEEAGVERVAVVRMFLSGESFAPQTRYLLGLTSPPPQRFLLMGEAKRLGPTPEPLTHSSEIVTHDEGIMLSPEATEIVAARARALAREPAQESVLLVAHGMGDEGANERVLDAMTQAAERISNEGFAAVAVETLREDWAEKRADAEKRIRAFVTRESSRGRRVIVVPYRLSGFGPYAEVLSGLNYTAADGLLPHPLISDWVSRTASEMICSQGWDSGLPACGAMAPTPLAPTR